MQAIIPTGKGNRRSSNLQRAIHAALRNTSAVAGAVLLGIVAVIMIAAPWIAPFNPKVQDLSARYAPPSRSHLFGTDEYGRDVLSRIFHGSRVSIVIAVLSVLGASAVGVPLGILAGYRRGYLDALLMRVVDAGLAFPSLIVGILVLVIAGTGTYKVVLAIAVALTPRFIRMSRSAVLVIRESEYVLASEAIGASSMRIMFHEILPNTLGTMLVLSALWTATAIRLEAGLSFLGLGVQPPTPSWGVMLRSGVQNMLMNKWESVFPGLAVFIAVMAFNLLGDGLRDALDPTIYRA